MFRVVLAMLFLFIQASGECAVSAAPNGSYGFELIDARPTSDKTRRSMSLNIFNCSYGIRHQSDKVTNPSRIELLHSDLNHLIGPLLASRKVTVKRYAYYTNDLGVTRKNINRTYRGLLADMSTAKASQCTEETTGEGWVYPYEVVSAQPPLILYITLEIEGRAYSVRSVHSPVELFTSKDKAKAIGELTEAVHKANKAIAKIIEETQDFAPNYAIKGPSE